MSRVRRTTCPACSAEWRREPASQTLQRLGVLRMGCSRDRLEPWIRETIRKRDPDLEEPLLAAIDAYDAICETARISPELLRPIVEAASSSRIPLYDTATTFLSKLTDRFPEVCDAVKAMFEAPRSHVRFNAILCLGSSTPPNLTFELLRRGLRDKSVRVRWKAADRAGRLRLRDLVPELEKALVIEKDSKASRTIHLELRLLRDGYILEPSGGGFTLTTFTPHGIRGRFISTSELEKRGIDALVEESSREFPP